MCRNGLIKTLLGKHTLKKTAFNSKVAILIPNELYWKKDKMNYIKFKDSIWINLWMGQNRKWTLWMGKYANITVELKI